MTRGGAIFLATPLGGGRKEISRMRLRSMSAGVASLMLITVIGTGCGPSKAETAEATRAEQAAARAEDAARRAESAASRVEAAAQRAEAAAAKAERSFQHGVRK